ncbi:hypothetical protein [Aminobacter ciceronei]|nr:hypothetical protein [Aminobacter ciceronei]
MLVIHPALDEVEMHVTLTELGISMTLEAKAEESSWIAPDRALPRKAA